MTLEELEQAIIRVTYHGESPVVSCAYVRRNQGKHT